MDHIRTLLPKVLQKRGLAGQADASLIRHQAMNWLHTKLPALCESGDVRVGSYKENVLTLKVGHSIAGQECQELSLEFMAYLQKECGHSRLENIRVERA